LVPTDDVDGPTDDVEGPTDDVEGPTDDVEGPTDDIEGQRPMLFFFQGVCSLSNVRRINAFHVSSNIIPHDFRGNALLIKFDKIW
jgi:hypothetical protein